MPNDLSGFDALANARRIVRNLDPILITRRARMERSPMAAPKKPAVPKAPAKPPAKAKPPGSCSCGGHKGGKKPK